MSEKTFKKVENELNIWNPVTGEILVCEVIRVSEGKYGTQYDVKTPDGKIKTLPSHKQLLSVLSAGEVKEGQTIRITFEGEKKAQTGREFRSYMVEIAQ